MKNVNIHEACNHNPHVQFNTWTQKVSYYSVHLPHDKEIL
jgi:hypothetical protein